MGRETRNALGQFTGSIAGREPPKPTPAAMAIVSSNETVPEGNPSSAVTEAYEKFGTLPINSNPQLALPPNIAGVLSPVAETFANSNKELYLVGGSVRDVLLGEVPKDLDLTTDATPDEIIELVKPHAETIWETGREFGTIAFKTGDDVIEITTYRTDSYESETRKPEVLFGTSIDEDLERRDLSINSIAMSLHNGQLVDPYNGIQDLRTRTLRTPGSPEQSFTDDPLRMLRVARFASKLGFKPHPELLQAMRAMKKRLSIVSAERVQVELEKIFTSNNPISGVQILEETEILKEVLPDVNYADNKTLFARTVKTDSFRQGTPEHRFALTAASLLASDERNPEESIRQLKKLRFTSQQVKTVQAVLMGHQNSKEMLFQNDYEIRKFAHHHKDHLSTIETIMRENDPEKYAEYMARRDKLSLTENLGSQTVPLSGKDIAEILEIKPSPRIGSILRNLQEELFKRGPMTRDEAEEHIKNTAEK